MCDFPHLAQVLPVLFASISRLWVLRGFQVKPLIACVVIFIHLHRLQRLTDGWSRGQNQNEQQNNAPASTKTMQLQVIRVQRKYLALKV